MSVMPVSYLTAVSAVSPSSTSDDRAAFRFEHRDRGVRRLEANDAVVADRRAQRDVDGDEVREDGGVVLQTCEIGDDAVAARLAATRRRRPIRPS